MSHLELCLTFLSKCSNSMHAKQLTLGSSLHDAPFISSPVIPLHEPGGHLSYCITGRDKVSPTWLWVSPVPFWGMCSVLKNLGGLEGSISGDSVAMWQCSLCLTLPPHPVGRENEEQREVPCCFSPKCGFTEMHKSYVPARFGVQEPLILGGRTTGSFSRNKDLA